MWNYRIVRHRSRGQTWYGLHEVYYRKNGKMYLWAPKPDAVGDTLNEVVAGLAMMLRDATKGAPILNKSQMPGENPKGKKKRPTK